jgi:hypothetical protein
MFAYLREGRKGSEGGHRNKGITRKEYRKGYWKADRNIGKRGGRQEHWKKERYIFPKEGRNIGKI